MQRSHRVHEIEDASAIHKTQLQNITIGAPTPSTWLDSKEASVVEPVVVHDTGALPQLAYGLERLDYFRSNQRRPVRTAGIWQRLEIQGQPRPIVLAALLPPFFSQTTVRLAPPAHSCANVAVTQTLQAVLLRGRAPGGQAHLLLAVVDWSSSSSMSPMW